MYDMQTKKQPSRQYIATGIIGIFAIISGLIVIQKKSLERYTVASLETNFKSQTLEELCNQWWCTRQQQTEQCFCSKN